MPRIQQSPDEDRLMTVIERLDQLHRLQLNTTREIAAMETERDRLRTATRTAVSSSADPRCDCGVPGGTHFSKHSPDCTWRKWIEPLLPASARLGHVPERKATAAEAVRYPTQYMYICQQCGGDHPTVNCDLPASAFGRSTRG